jgi:hypothetical protein
MTNQTERAVRMAAAKAGLNLNGLALHDERGELLERRVCLVDLGLFLGVLRSEALRA